MHACHQQTPMTATEHDIFISYSHKDNNDGWVDEFQLRLARQLERFTGEEFRIWRDDHGLRRPHHFEPQIKEAISKSAAFLPLLSPAYLKSDYCRMELEWYCEFVHAIQTRLIFVTLLTEISHFDWPAPCQGRTAFTLYENYRTATNPLYDRSELDSVEFHRQIRILSDQISRELAERQRARSITRKKRVFLACACDEISRRRLRFGLIEHCEVLDEVPPPFEPADHEQMALEMMREADLCVHLLAGSERGKIAAESASHYAVTQAQLGLRESHPQLFLLPNGFNASTIVDPKLRELLTTVQPTVAEDGRSIRVCANESSKLSS